jgi:uncharacterized membrane protein
VIGWIMLGVLAYLVTGFLVASAISVWGPFVMPTLGEFVAAWLMWPAFCIIVLCIAVFDFAKQHKPRVNTLRAYLDKLERRRGKRLSGD